MATRFWRCILGLALALAGLSGILLATALELPAATTAAVALGIAPMMFVAIVVSSFAISQSEREGHGAPSDLRQVLRALLSELAEFPLAVLAMSRHSRPMPPPPPPAIAPGSAAPAHRPVLLLHGFLCNSEVWRSLRNRLCAAGFGPIEALDIEPLLADIDIQSGHVAPRLLALQRQCQGERVIIIAHSMGGLIARTLLRDLGAGAIRRIVTIASPHHGTTMVRGLPWPDTRQMSRASPWLEALNRAQEGRFTVPVTSIFTAQDNLVAPGSSARLEGAELHELRGVGHLGILRSHRALECVMQCLTQAGAL